MNVERKRCGRHAAARVAWPLLASVLLVASAAGQTRSDSDDLAVLVDGLGAYSRLISTRSKRAQAFFDQGLRLIWAYYFPEAVASFREAERADPAHPMIHWGIALAVGPNPNSRRAGRMDDPQGQGIAAIRRAVQLADHGTAVEQDLIEALAIRYDAQARPDRAERDRAYHERLRELRDEYPDDPDIAALFADAYMTIRAWDYWDAGGEPLPGTMEAGDALERAMRAYPDHPGIAHLYIHLYESSSRPERALPAADRLEALMPRAGHIVHMPSHIYVRVGEYAKAVAQNRRSVTADELFLAAWGERQVPFVTSLPMSAVLHDWHAYDFMRHAALQQGNYAVSVEAAEAALRVARRFSGDGPCAADRNVMLRWMVDKAFGRWRTLLRQVGAEPEPECALLRGMWHYMRGSALAGIGDLEGADREASTLDRRIGAGAAAPGDALDLLRIAARNLEGEIGQARGEPEAAVEAFRQAVALEDALPYSEPPAWPLPMRRYLGAALLAAGRGAEAERVYAEDLQWHRNNGWSLYGLWQSRAAQGKRVEADETRAAFEHAWQDADVTLPASRF